MRSNLGQPSAFTPRLNLLPIRRHQRRAHRLRFLLLSLTLLLLLIPSLVLTHGFIQTERQQLRLASQSLVEDAKQLQAASLIDLTTAPSGQDLLWLEQWLQRRADGARALQQLAQLTPDSVALTHFKQQGTTVILSGHARSALDLQQFETTLARKARWGRITRLTASAAVYKQFPVQTFSLQASTNEGIEP